MKVINDEEAEVIVSKNAQNTSCELERIYYNHTGRRILKWHHYLQIYDFHMSLYRKTSNLPDVKRTSPLAKNEQLKVLELGVQNGGSLQMWRKYFGENAIIYGIDIDPRCKNFEEDGCKIRIGSQDDEDFLLRVVEEMGGVDIVLDDGSHIASHQVASFKALFGKLNKGGIYIVEDLHTSYWDGWEGGLKRTGTFIEIVKDIIDHMHAWYVEVNSELNNLNLKYLVTGMHIYDSMVVIEKASKTEPYAVHVGNTSFETEDSEINDNNNKVSNFSKQSQSWKKHIALNLNTNTKNKIRKLLRIFNKHV